MTIILVVENHSELRKTIRQLLEKHMANYEIIEASTGKEGMEKAIRQKPDVVVLDIMLPDMNGLTVARQIKQTTPSAKIILLTMCAEGVACQCDPTGITTTVKKNEIFKKLIPVIKNFSKEDKRQVNRSINNRRSL